MLGFDLTLAILAIVLAIVMVITVFCVDTVYKFIAVFVGICSIVFCVFMFNYIYNHEASYYADHGNPKIRYGQVQSMSTAKISVYYDTDRSQSSNFTIYDPSLLKGLNEGDVVKVVYVDGIYRAFALNLQKFVPASQP